MTVNITVVEVDSDLEGVNDNDTIEIHDDILSSNVTSNYNSVLKKRNFQEMNDNCIRNNDNQKITEMNVLLDAFLNDDSYEDEDENEDSKEELETEDYESESNGELNFDVNESNSNANIQIVEFEMKDIYDEYYHEIRDILASTDFDQNKLHVSELANTIVKQEEVGGVLTSQTSVLGFISVLSMKQHFEHLSIAHIRRFLSNRCKHKSIKKKFEECLNTKNVGLLIHERPLNTPLEIIPHIYDSLYQDLKWVTNSENSAQVGKHLSDKEITCFSFDLLLIIVKYRWISVKKVSVDDDEDAFSSLLKKNKKNKLFSIQPRKNMHLVYEHLEDEIFVKCSQFSFAFERKEKVWNVCMIDIKHFPDIIHTLQQNFFDKL